MNISKTTEMNVFEGNSLNDVEERSIRWVNKRRIVSAHTSVASGAHVILYVMTVVVENE